MKRILEELGYSYDSRTRIWKSKDYESINYSDGDSVENAIALAIASVKDKSVLSNELKSFCVDWPSTYHLSSIRANVLRPFDDLLKGDILEIGAGCGAITRYLGECGGNVLALEGSIQRAEIARSRTRDLENVHVLAETFHQFQPTAKFDVITLIGVLEYSNLFIPSDTPALSVLEKVQSLLKPNGILIIAIENQFGLKYFAGAAEDHLNIPMYGVESKYEANQPETFGKKNLESIVNKAGLPFVEFMAPFPDYKLPTSIVTEAGFTDPNFDASVFAWQSVRNDPQLPKYLTFSPELAWPKIFENNLGLDLSNSFLICASMEPMVKSHILAHHYTADRKPAYCKELIVQRDGVDNINVHFKKLAKSAALDETLDSTKPIIFTLPDTQPYIQGNLLSLQLISILKKDDWSIEQVCDFVKRYIKIISQITQTPISLDSSIDKDIQLPNWSFDLIPQNILILSDGSPRAIDIEWRLSTPMSLGYLLFRAILNVMNKLTRVGLHVHRHPFTRGYFLLRAIQDAGVNIVESDLHQYTQFEAIIQSSVTGRSSENFLNWNESELLNTNNLFRIHQILENEKLELASKSATNSNFAEHELRRIETEIKGSLNNITQEQLQSAAISQSLLLKSDQLIESLSELLSKSELSNEVIIELQKNCKKQEILIEELKNEKNIAYLELKKSKGQIKSLEALNASLSEEIANVKSSLCWKIFNQKKN